MRILYGIQATGNGHISRAIKIAPELAKHAEIDILISGTENSIRFPYEIDFQKHGLSFYFGQKGSIDIFKSLKNFRPARLIKDIMGCQVEDYDLIVTDYEPITAWASKRKDIKSISVSHQASFHYTNTPRPEKRNRLGECVLKYYAPTQNYLGLHFQSYNSKIFLPVIREDIRNLKIENAEHYVVYLPAYSPSYLAHYLNKFDDVNWRVFSKHCRKYAKIHNVEIFPTSNRYWKESFQSCKGILLGAGFEGPSEALFLGKKMMVIPMKGQYEQLCNVIALKELGIPHAMHLNNFNYQKIRNWINEGTSTKINFADSTPQIVSNILAS